MNIKQAKVTDKTEIEDLYRRAFGNQENELVAKLASDLLEEGESNNRIISLIADEKNKILGHISLSPILIENNKRFNGYILAPLAVLPGFQKQGIGKMLIQESKKILQDKQVNMLFVYGDPNYYKRFGFVQSDAKKYIPPYKLEYEFGWQEMTFNALSNEKQAYNLYCVKSLCIAQLW